jgi:hypothetical protein
LADKSGQRAEVFSDAKDFLEKIIEDNAISYPQDRKCKEWTFNYYIRNARASLDLLAKHWPEQVPAYEGSTLTPTKRWEYCQKLLEEAVTGFETAARNKRDRDSAARRSRETRSAAKERKRMSREITLAARSAKVTP